MNAAVELKSEVDELLALSNGEGPFDYDPAEVLPQQIAAANARFRERVGQIKLLQNRAETGGIDAVAKPADIVPLLFAHTAYKSYPEGWLFEKKWDRLGRWLDTVSSNRVGPVDTSEVKGLDDWLAKLAEQGHFVSCSSGTTGKCSMMNATAEDLDFCGKALLQALVWMGIKPTHDKLLIGPGQVAVTARNRASGRPMYEALGVPGSLPWTPDVPPITIGGITDMVVLRNKITEGTATPSEAAEYEVQVDRRQKNMDDAVEQAAEAFIAHRHEKIHVTGMFGPLYKVAELIRAKGYGGKDFNPENSTYLSGGLKRVQVPDNYREIIFDTFNLKPENIGLAYGMQEINSTAPRCTAGRYHLPPWLMLLLLDEPGENLIEPPKSGEVEGRAAFFDIAMQGRWGGTISGDKVHATWERCACGARSPSISEDIQRYADLASGDKIACAGTIDAYVRGVA
jgi:hypothetical protein